MKSLESKRLRYRLTNENDVQNIFELDGDPEVMKYINGGIPDTLEEVKAKFEKYKHRIMDNSRQFGCWMADLKSTGENIGWFILKPISDEIPGIEVGYRLKKRFWGNGYATEGACEMIRHGFDDLGLNEIVAIVDPAHNASRHVLEKCGLTFKDMRMHENFEVCYYVLPINEYEHSRSNP